MAENQNIEWKESWCNGYLKWICQFKKNGNINENIALMFFLTLSQLSDLGIKVLNLILKKQ